MSETAPVEWCDVKFGQLCQRIVNGGTPSTDVGRFWSGVTPWVTGADFTSKGIGEIRRFVSEAGIRASATSVVKAGNLLVVTRTGVGKLAIAPFDIAISQDISGVYVDGEKAVTGFVFHLLTRELEELKKLNQGTSINGIIRSDLERHVVRIPRSKTAQLRIAAILTSIDTAIEKSEALIAKYLQIKAGLMHDLFTRGVLPNGQLRPPREQAPELYQETATGWIPSGWKIGQIGAYFEIQLGKMLNQLARTGRNSFLYLGNRSVQWNRLEVDDLELMDFSPEEQKKFALQYGDLLVCEGGEVGRTAIWESQIENCYYQKAIHRLRAKDGGVKPRFVLWYMHFAQTSGRFSDFTSQSSIAHLTQEKLAKVPVLVPPTPEQELIVLRVDTQEALIEGQRNYLANLRAQKLGLMQDLLTGKVAVKVDAHASEADL